MSPEKAKKKRLKERKHSENENNLGIVKEQKHLEKKKSKLALKKKRRREEGNEVDSGNGDRLSHKDEHTRDEINYEYLDSQRKSPEKNKSKLALKKKRRREKAKEVDSSNDYHFPKVEHTDDAGSTPESHHSKRSTDFQNSSEIGSFKEHKEASNGTKIKTKRVKKEMKRRKKDFQIAKERKIEETLREIDAEKVDEISSVDEDCSRGMKKWLIKCKESRPGLKILQQRIDDFITTYEEQQEQERIEREAQAAEGGWTVVVHHKGRKKTTDAESGVTVGSVSQAAVVDKMGKKKAKEVPSDFYRFKKREAQRNEVMMLQSKFEQDKKRIQQLRAARKFRPY